MNPFIQRLQNAAFRRMPRLTRFRRKPGRELLFVYSGRTHCWLGMGRTLYQQEPVFRASIQETSQLIYTISGRTILPNFTGPDDPDFFAVDGHVLFTTIAVQLALTDLWVAKGVTPDACLGVSLGEVAAVYAAGGLSRPDVIRICYAWYVPEAGGAGTYVSLHVKLGLRAAQAICRRCPAPLMVVYEAGPNGVMAFCKDTDKPTVAAFLDEQGVGWSHPFAGQSKAFHTPVYAQHEAIMWEHLRQVRPQPLRVDVYSPTLGRRFAKHALVPNALWVELLCSPILLYTTLQAVIADGRTILTTVGPHPFLTSGTQTDAFDMQPHAQLLDSMRQHTDERAFFDQTHRRLRQLVPRLKQTGRPPQRLDADGFAGFVGQLNLSDPATAAYPQETYAYLRERCRICFMPVHQAWLVFNYEEVSRVLQQPVLFSSSPYQNFDALLLGADPPDHAAIRSMLQPLFTPQATANLVRYIQDSIDARLRVLVERDQFDVVNELTIPLVKAISARFLGLSATDVAVFEASLSGHHLYSLTYLNELDAVCRTYFRKQPTTGMCGVLSEQVRVGRLSFEGAVGLLKLMWIASTSTTSILLTNIVDTLIRQPQLADQLRDDDARIARFVEECLRLNPPEPTLWRLTTQETELAGQPLPVGSLVILGTLGANYDPQAFAEPNQLVLTRPAKRHLAFGTGAHHCIGAGLARQQAYLLTQAILTLPTLRRTETGMPVYYSPTSLRGLARLLVSTS